MTEITDTEIKDHFDLLEIALRHYAKAELLFKVVEYRRTDMIHELALECVGLASAIAKANVAEILNPPDESP